MAIFGIAGRERRKCSLSCFGAHMRDEFENNDRHCDMV